MDVLVAARPGRGCIVVHVEGALDYTTVPQARGVLQDAIDDGASAVVLDLTAVPFADSAAVGMIVWVYKLLQERGGHVAVAATEPIVLRVLDLTSIDRLVNVYASVEAAEDNLAG